MGEDKRKDPRADVRIEIQYQTDQEFLAAYTKNISGGGVFIRTSHPLQLNQTVALRFTLPGINCQFEIGGLVVWANSSPRSAFPAGMGVKFMEITPADSSAVATFVKNAGGEATGLDKKT